MKNEIPPRTSSAPIAIATAPPLPMLPPPVEVVEVVGVIPVGVVAV
jgi:hypothetical protein